MPSGYNSYQHSQYQRMSPYQGNHYQRGMNPYQWNMRQNPYQQNQRLPINQRNQSQTQINPYLLNGYQQTYQSHQSNPQQQAPQQQSAQRQAAPYHDPMVTFEPLDEKTLNEMRTGPQADDTSQDGEKEGAITVYALDKKIVEKIGGFAQNEKNASLYYKNLSEYAYNGRDKRILSKISDASQRHIGEYQSIYKSFSGNEYDLKDNDVLTDVDFHEGIRFAILEETDQLEELNDLFNELPDEKSLKALNKMMNRKINVINFLRNLQT